MEYVVFELSVIIISTAVLCFAATMAKQPLIVAYIFAGFLVGPYGLNIIHFSDFFSAISQVGIVLLLYLIGLELKPSRFFETLRKSYPITVFASLATIPIAFFIGWISGLAFVETVYLAIAFLFSSTVVVIKTIHDEKGVDPEVFNSCVGILLVQDMIAVITLIVINSIVTVGKFEILEILRFFFSALLFVAMAFFFQHYSLRRILRRIMDRTDLVFLIGLAWCFLFAELAEVFHLTREIGGFIAGLSLTSLPEHKLKVFIHKSETIRDFFMILFFFVLGANLRLEGVQGYSLLISLSLVFILLVKPYLYYFFARRARYTTEVSRELGLRLGQISEFSIIIAAFAATSGSISSSFSMVIQVLLFLSIVFSNYVVKFFRPKFVF